MDKRLLFLSLACLFALNVIAQDAPVCLDFEEFQEGAQFGPATGVSPGDVIFSEQAMEASLLPITYLNGNIGFGNAMVYGGSADWLDNQFFFMGNNSLNFDFSAYPGGASEVCFEFFDGGGEENFAVNGSPVSVVSLFSEIGQLPNLPNVDIDISFTDGFLESGTVCIRGAIESLLIGGQEFGIDNFCFQPSSVSPNCPIANLQASILECNDDGTYDIEVDFDWLSPLTVITDFNLFLDGNFSYTFSQTELPLTIENVLPQNSAKASILRPDAAAGFYTGASPALFGPALPDGGLAGEVVRAYDEANSSLACSTIVNPDAVQGKIALVDRGACPFEQKAVEAEAAGAIGLIICNSEDSLPLMSGVPDISDPGIPTVALKSSDCQRIRELIEEYGVVEMLLEPQEVLDIRVCQSLVPDCCASYSLLLDCPPIQQRQCVEFEGLEETLYGNSTGVPPGTEIYTESNVGLRLAPFQSLFWFSTYGDLRVINAADDPTMMAASGKHLKFESINAVFDLTAYPEPVDSVKVDFYYGTGSVNIAANGANILIQNNLSPGFYALAPGINLQVVFNTGSGQEGQLIFYGNIQSLLIGGDGDFRIDNLCINGLREECELGDMLISALPCTSTDGLFFELDFADYQGVSDSFLLLDYTGDVHPIAYSSLPDTLGPLPFTNSGIYYFEAVDAGQNTCFVSDTIQAEPCTGCAFEGVTIDYEGQTASGQTVITLDFELVGLPNTDFFSIYFNGELYERYPWNSVPVEIAVPCSDAAIPTEITICEGENDCCFSLPLLGIPPCTGGCELYDMRVQAGPCNPNGVFDVKLDLNYQNASDSFELWLNGNATGQFFAYADLPITLSPFVAPTDTLIFQVFDTGNPDCTASALLPPADCSPCNTPIDSVSYYLTDCNDDGGYFIVIEAIFPLPPNANAIFWIMVDGEPYGDYDINSFPIELGPFPGDGSEHEVVIKTDDTANCAYSFLTEPVDCGLGCRLSNMVLDPQPCNDAGEFMVEVDFDYQGVSDSFFLSASGPGAGAYAYGSLPILVGPYQESPFEWPFEAYDLGDPNCGIMDTLPPIDCNQICSPIQEVEYHLTDCSPDGQFGIVLENIIFQPPSTGASLSFAVVINGQDFGFYNIGDLPITLAPLTGDGSTVYEVSLITQNTTDCVYSFTVGPIDCGGGCPLEWLELLSTPECPVPGGDYYIVRLEVGGAQFGDLLTVTSQLTNFSTTVIYNGQLLELELPYPGTGYDELTVCLPATSNTSFCCLETSFDIACPPCTISDLRIDPHPCNDDGTFFFEVDFEAVGTFSDTFELSLSNGATFGFHYNDLPVTLGPIPGTGEELFVWLFDHTGDCGINAQLPTPDCNQGNCFIEPRLDAVCHPDGGYTLYVDADYGGVGSQLEILSEGAGISYSIAYADLPIELFIPYNGPEDYIFICDNEHPNCCTAANVIIDCPCPLGGLAIDPNGCRDDGSFTAILNISSTGPYEPNDTFVVEGPNYYGLFTFGELPVEVGPFPGDGAPLTLEAFVPGTDCGQTATFLAPNCGNGNCLFSNVIAEPYDCNSDGQFWVDIEANVNNPGVLGYFIFADGEIYGPFSYDEPFVTLGPFAGDGSTVYDFLILDIENPSCFGYVEVGPIDCDNTLCAIRDIVVDPLDCNDDGTYNLFLDFEVANPGNAFFDLFDGNGNLIGFYPLNDLPLIVEGFEPSGNANDVLKVCINDRPDCCRVVEFPAPNCSGDCRIYDVGVEFAYCDALGNFYVQLSFGFENPGSDGYSVRGNGQDYGTFSYNEPFPVIGPFPSAADPVWELIVRDNNHPDCGGSVEFVSFDCPPDPTEICLTFDEFNDIGDTLLLAGPFPEDSIYDEDGIILDAVAIPLGNDTAFFQSVVGSPVLQCSSVAPGGLLRLDGGIAMDLRSLPNLPIATTFEFSFCLPPNAIPWIVIGVDGELYSGSIFGLPDELPGGIGIELALFNDNGLNGQITLYGPIEDLLIGGRWMYVDNICFSQPLPPMDDNDCVSFDMFDGSPTDTLANFGRPEELSYEEDGVVVSARGIEWNGVADYFSGVYAYQDNNCGFGDDDAALTYGGALRFNFANVENGLPTELTFHLAFCPGQAQQILLIVDGEAYRGDIGSLPDVLPNGIMVAAAPTTPSGAVWQVELLGAIENLTVGGGSLTIDDICFYADPDPEEVWPGDANADNLAHHVDLLNIGLAYGAQGTARFEDGANWMAFSAANWGQEFADGTDYKHADCNGDGRVDADDREAIVQNYGLAHGPFGGITELPGTDTDPPVALGFGPEYPNGASFNIPILVGTASQPMEDVYGIAFTVEFDPQVIDPTAIAIDYPVSWFGEPGINTLSVDRTYASDGRIEIAMTRIDQNNVSGYGPVAYLIGIIDDIAGLHQCRMSVNKIKAIRKDEMQIPVRGLPISFEIVHKKDEDEDSKGIFSVFPNPATDWVTVTSRHGFEPEALSLMSIDGNVLAVPQENNNRISLQGLPAGTYILRITNGAGLVHKKIIKY